jgi:hypothetical protein
MTQQMDLISKIMLSIKLSILQIPLVTSTKTDLIRNVFYLMTREHMIQ